MMAEGTGEPTKPRDSFDIIGDPRVAAERLQRASMAAARLRDYRRMLLELMENRSKIAEIAKLRGLLTDRAYEAEHHTRMLLKDGIDALNDLRDTGRLEGVLQQAVAELRQAEGVAEIRRGLKLAQTAFKEQLRGDESVFDDLEKAFSDQKIGIESDGEMIRASFVDLDGKTRSFRISPRPLAGHMGRVSSAAFFSPDLAGGTVLANQPYFVIAGDHHDYASHLKRQSEGGTIDLYGSMIAGAAATREMMYRHARLVAEVGAGVVQGEDPITALVIVLSAGALALIIGGVSINIQCAQGALQGDICDFGKWFILAGVVLGGFACVASGLCSLVIQNITVIGA